MPIAGKFVYWLVEDPTASSTLYAGTTDGLYKSIDGGDSWTESDTGIPSLPFILELAIDPEVPTTLYAATNTLSVGAYKSVDGGAHWAPSGTGLTISPNGGFQALAVDPHDSKVAYAGAYATGLFKSTDGGATWHSDDGATGVTDIWSVAVDPSDSNVVYVFTSKGAFKSTDAGGTWVESDNGLSGNTIMTDIQFDPSDRSILYVSPRYGLGDSYMSPNAGADWFDLTTLASGSQAVTQSVTLKATRRSSALDPGLGHGPRTSSVTQFTVGSVVVDPRKSRQILGGGTDGQVYSFDVKDLPTVSSSGGRGGSGSGSGGSTAPTSSDGGGGNFGLLLILGLAGFVARRRIR